jgi:carboxymethylenebutenolidase
MGTTDQYEGMVAETVAVRGHRGDFVHAYFARPAGAGPFPGMLLVHHLPGWDEWYKEITRRFAHHGYAAICPDLYCREGHGPPDDVAARVRAQGGVPDEQVVGDAEGAIAFLRALPTSNGKVGVMGTCSGGRHAYLVACLAEGVDAAVDCWGGNVVMDPADLDALRPVAPIEHTKTLQCPLLGLFGEDDRSPSPEQVAEHEAALEEHGKDYEFHMYAGAGHGFFYHDRPAAFRTEQAVDGWGKVWDFLGRHLR